MNFDCCALVSRCEASERFWSRGSDLARPAQISYSGGFARPKLIRSHNRS